MVGCRSPPIAPAGARYRSAGSSLSNQVNTVCRKLPTMMPTDVIMAMAVASAATSTDVLRNDPPRLRDASNASTPSRRRSAHRPRGGGAVHHQRSEQRSGSDKEQGR